MIFIIYSNRKSYILGGKLHIMTSLVRNGYTPDELESFEKHEKRDSILILGLIIALYLTAFIPDFYYDFPLKDTMPPLLYDFVTALIFCELLIMILLAASTMPKMDFRNKICKSLAGLELGVIHCSDDLVILLNLPREYADMVIDGQYDNWLRSKKVCRLIG